MEVLVEPIYAEKDRCTNSKDVIESILRKFPNENLVTLAERAGVVRVISIQQWIDRNSAKGTNMRKLYESIIRDYRDNNRNSSGLYIVK